MIPQVITRVINYRIPCFSDILRVDASFMNYISLNRLESQQQERQRSMSYYLVYYASKMYSKTYKRAVRIDCFGVRKNSYFPAFVRGRRWKTYSSNQTETQWFDVL